MIFKKLLSFFIASLVITACWAQGRQFNHPGSVLSASDFTRIKTHVDAGDEPWASCWKGLQAYSLSKSTYTASPSAEIGGSDGTRQRAASDAYAVMLNAIEWHITGQKAYADCAARILTQWGKTLKTANGELFQYPCRAFIVAAELLRTPEGFYEGWAKADRDTFLNKVRTVMVPACRKFCTYQGTHPSWYTPAALAVEAAGVLLDDTTLYQEGYDLMMSTAHWDAMYGGSILPGGQVREMGRDNVHGQLTFTDIAQACLVAWNQGDDLFGAGDNRLLQGLEYWCHYNTGHTDLAYEPLQSEGNYHYYYISTHNNGFRLRPDCFCLEAVYHHYKEVKGMDPEKDFPYLDIATRLARPDTASQMLGFGTLLYTIDAASSPIMTEKPQKPVNFKAENGYNSVYLSWQHPEKEDARGFRIYRSTNGTSFSLLTTMDYYTNNEYKDEDVTDGTTYYYKVQFINKAGYSEMSDVAQATPQTTSDALPLGWAFASIGNNLGAGGFTAAQDTTITVSGAGTDIGGTGDSEGFVYCKMKGDATLTARLVSTTEAFYKVGVQMRTSLSATSPRVAITLGEKGYRYCRTATRTSYGANTTWQDGADYGKAPFWMRIQRTGNKFYTFISRDGKTWHQIGSATCSMSNTYYVGLASCSGSATTTYEAAFDHVTLEGTLATPTAVPAAPTRLSAEWTESNQATLTWRATSDADSFRVCRLRLNETLSDYELQKTTGYDTIATVRATSYVDNAATEGIYAYRITALNAVGESKPSGAKQVTTGEIKKITGTIIGTTGSYKNNSATMRNAALDGSLSTYFDAAEESGAWVGYDLGVNRSAQVVYVMYAPRKGYPSRMTGGKFQAANTVDFSDAVTLATVAETPAENTLTKLVVTSPAGKTYRYLRYIGPDKGNCNVAEVQFYGRIEDLTGIERLTTTPSATQGNTVIYDLQGRVMSGESLPRGIYIVRNGNTARKVMVK